MIRLINYVTLTLCVCSVCVVFNNTFQSDMTVTGFDRDLKATFYRLSCPRIFSDTTPSYIIPADTGLYAVLALNCKSKCQVGSN